MSIDTLVILVLVVASIFGLIALERHSRKNQARDKANEGKSPAEKRSVE